MMPIELVDLAAVFVVVAIPLAILSIVLSGDWSELEIHAPAHVLDWPQGVQEEEPVRWRVERLTRPGHVRGPVTVPHDRGTERPEPARA